MATKRLSVNQKEVNFFDGMRITEDEMRAEQSRNINIDAANVANFFGSGIIEEAIIPNVIFDSADLNAQQQVLFDGYSFDGQNIYVGTPLTNVSDETSGVQLVVTLTNVSLTGAASTSVSIIGDEFGDNIIHDDLIFHENGFQITRGRYINIRSIIFNNFAGNLNGSAYNAVDSTNNHVDGYEWVGRCVISEAKSMQASYDAVVSSQTDWPSKYFEDFHPADPAKSVEDMLDDALTPEKAFSDLNIGLGADGYDGYRDLVENNVTTKIGQKFKAVGTNIQKISVLLAIKSAGGIDPYAWTGDIVLTLYALQTEVTCPLTPTPDNEVDFDPDPAIVAQLSLDKDDLELRGISLTGTPQVVDFVFVENKIADPRRTPIELDKYYVFTIGRAGDAISGTIRLVESNHVIEYGYMTIYDGTQWVNVTESDMWFCIYGDYVKASSGIAYEEGIGFEIPKLEENNENVEVPYLFDTVPFYTVTYDTYNYIVATKVNDYSDPVQDQRTGDDVWSRVAPSPSVSLINKNNLDTLLLSNPAPIMLGRVKDLNPRGNDLEITGTTELAGLTLNNEFNVLRPDADLLSNNVIGSILTPNVVSCGYRYRITKAELVTDAYGDINGDGVIDDDDLTIMSAWIADGYSYDLSTLATQKRVVLEKVSAEQILRADLNGDGVVDSTDESLLRDYIDKKTNSFPVGSTFTRMKLTVESLLDPLTTTVDIPGDDDDAFKRPTKYDLAFQDINWKIDYVATWIPDWLEIQDLRRSMPTTFTTPVSDTLPSGSNDFYAPGNIIIGNDMLDPDGTPYSIDFEFVQIMLDIPITDSYANATFLDGYVGILLFDDFVCEEADGKTIKGFNALKYNDGTYVQPADFSAGKVKISPSLQSTASEYAVTFGTAIEDIIGLYYNPEDSLLTLYMKDLFNDHDLDAYRNILPAVSTKILVSVYLKRAGFANSDVFVTDSQMRNVLDI